MWIFLGVIATTLIGGALFVDSVRRSRSEEADELEFARLRLVAAGEDPDAVTVFTADSTVYTSQHAVITGTDHPVTVIEPFDERTAALADDPTLTATEIADVIHHMEPGEGSLASFAATVYDTWKMRTAAERRDLEAVYDEAHDEDIRRDLSAAFAGLTESSRDVWATIDAWVAKYHGEDHYADCVHCAEVHKIHSDEYALILADRSSTDTGEISKADVVALYATQGATI